MQKIKNIIFDMGGVILPLDFQQTFKAFERLAFNNFEKLFNKAYQHDFIVAYETGEITSAEFRTHIRNILEIDVDDSTVDHAWNAMLVGFPTQNIDFVRQEAKNKRTFLLSNTNVLHLTAAENILTKEHPKVTWEMLFEKTYFSHLVGDRKPNISIFEKVIEENSLVPEETVFIDDSIQHIKGAKKAGLHVIHLKDKMSITDLSL
ncbi:MAG: HAD family phosphatase [Bacteroidota bacterium]